MKKIVLLCICAIIWMGGYCQEQHDSTSVKYVSEHIKFMGIPMDGSFDDFRDKIIAKGFRFEMINDNNLTILSGYFANHRADVLLQPNRDDEIYRVQLIFSDGGQYFTSWKDISRLYFELKELLISKYGEPDECKEKFKGARPSTDRGKIIAVAQDRCNYSCAWKLYGEATFEGSYVVIKGVSMPIGNIFLHIADQTVRLSYTDIQQEMKQDDQNFNDI